MSKHHELTLADLPQDLMRKIFKQLDAGDLDNLVKCRNKKLCDVILRDTIFQCEWLLYRYGSDALVHALSRKALATDARVAALLRFTGAPGRFALLDQIDYHYRTVHGSIDKLWTPIHTMCDRGYSTSMAEVLADQTTYVLLRARTKLGRTPLLLAINSGARFLAMDLLRLGCFSEMDDLVNLIHMCSKEGRYDMLEHLGARGLLRSEIINAPNENLYIDCVTNYDEELNMPLQLAAYHGRASTCELLLRYGADPECGDTSGNSFALAFAVVESTDPPTCAVLSRAMTPDTIESALSWPMDLLIDRDDGDEYLQKNIVTNMCAVFDEFDIPPRESFSDDFEEDVRIIIDTTDTGTRFPDFASKFTRAGSMV